MSKTAPTNTVDIYIAGDYAEAKALCRSYCFANPLCVHIVPIDYVYTGGAEEGVKIGLINYPRFPTSPDALRETALDLADFLMRGLHQHSYTVVASAETIWISRRPETN